MSAADAQVGVQESPNMQLVKKKKLTTDDYVNGILERNMAVLSKAITLIESNSLAYISQAQDVLQGILPQTGRSIRVGISGPPGAGKSTTIESLGCYLCKQGLKVAVLAIDPSSTLTKGSILGDKTRMELLSREKNAYIRPSPSAGTLGGVARKTRETILACEAAGYDVILIETIGVGQSEITVRSMVDFFLLVLIPGSGDELQGIKKGVVEISDMIAINKADGDNIQFANLTKSAYQQAVGMLHHATPGWKTIVRTFSALQNKGIADIWTDINTFMDLTKQNGAFEERRNSQVLHWVKSMVEEELTSRFYNNAAIQEMRPKVVEDVLSGALTPTSAVELLLNTYYSKQ
jgi:LAO/AO transport system kinase